MGVRFALFAAPSPSLLPRITRFPLAANCQHENGVDHGDIAVQGDVARSDMGPASIVLKAKVANCTNPPQENQTPVSMGFSEHKCHEARAKNRLSNAEKVKQQTLARLSEEKTPETRASYGVFCFNGTPKR